jgi:hypothetical protein
MVERFNDRKYGSRWSGNVRRSEAIGSVSLNPGKPQEIIELNKLAA